MLIAQFNVVCRHLGEELVEADHPDEGVGQLARLPGRHRLQRQGRPVAQTLRHLAGGSKIKY